MGQAQYIEGTLFLSNYLLSSQGDRMAMANAVVGTEFFESPMFDRDPRAALHLLDLPRFDFDLRNPLNAVLVDILAARLARWLSSPTQRCF